MPFYRNTSKGARGILLRNDQTLLVEPGATVSVATAAIKAMPGGLVEVESPSAEPAILSLDEVLSAEVAEPGPLDASIPDLTAYLAEEDDPDAVQALIDAETAGKSRKGALEVLEARRDELLA